MKGSWYPRLVVGRGHESLVSSSGAVLLREAVRLSGLDAVLSDALAPWRSDRALHDPAKVLVDEAMVLALGGDCMADLAVLRAQPGVFGTVASDATASRVLSALAAGGDEALSAIRDARVRARDRVWSQRRPLGSSLSGQVIVDVDATVVTAHSEKESAAPTYKRTFGFHPMCALVDHGEHGTGEPLVLTLRAGNASAMGAADHIAVLDAALAQLPATDRAQVLVRTDAGGCSKAFLHHITDAGLQYSIGFGVSDPIRAAIATIPVQAWRAALNGDGEARDGAQVAELTAWMPTTTRDHLTGLNVWPVGMRIIARRERPHPGAQLRLTDEDGWRITCFATNTRGPGWTLPMLEVRHRQRARAEDRIRSLKDTGMRNLPFHGFAHNQLWLEIVSLAAELIAWTQTLGFHEHSPVRRWAPKKLRLRLFSVAGRIVHTGRRRRLHLPRDWPYLDLLDTAWTTLQTA